MLVKTDQWESYTDRAGRRHWRWPASAGSNARDDREAVARARERSAWPSPQPASLPPLPARGR